MAVHLVVIIIVVVVIVLLLWWWSSIPLAIVNGLYSLDSSARTNFYTEEQSWDIFPVGDLLQQQWRDIKVEGQALYASLTNPGLNYLSNYSIDVGEEDLTHWTTIPLRLFGRDAPTYLQQCPVLREILSEHPEIRSCLFSIMDAGKEIMPHRGPYDGLLRYQLALDIPPGECYLHVGGERHYWTEGKGVMFDESNVHGAVNHTQRSRMVLLIDLERPYDWMFLRWLNRGIIWGMGALPATGAAVQ